MRGIGMLTDEIKEKSIHLVGYGINQKELRLMPYPSTCLKEHRILGKKLTLKRGLTQCRTVANNLLNAISF